MAWAWAMYFIICKQMGDGCWLAHWLAVSLGVGVGSLEKKHGIYLLVNVEL